MALYDFSEESFFLLLELMSLEDAIDEDELLLDLLEELSEIYSSLIYLFSDDSDSDDSSIFYYIYYDIIYCYAIVGI